MDVWDLVGKGMTAEEMDEALDKANNKQRPPFEPFSFQWSLNEVGRDKRAGAISPITRSRYARELFKNPAGWK